MLSKEARVRLREMGVFPSDEDGKDHKDAKPFFVIRSDSEDPTKEELDRLGSFTEAYRTRYGPNGTVDTYWGRMANTITLWKIKGVWTYRRMTWTDKGEWSPDPRNGLSVEALFTMIMHGTA